MTNKSMHPSSTIDEALWAAYRRDDKAAVMDYLFRRRLVEIGRSRSFSQLVIKGGSKRGRAAGREHGRPMLMNDRARRLSLQSTLN